VTVTGRTNAAGPHHHLATSEFADDDVKQSWAATPIVAGSIYPKYYNCLSVAQCAPDSLPTDRLLPYEVLITEFPTLQIAIGGDLA
jgi:hypothetical protein